MGSAHVVIRAITDKLAGDIQKGLQRAAPAASSSGGTVGKSFKNGFERNADVDAADPVRRASRGAETAAGGMGGRVGRAFTGGFQRSGASRTFISIGLRIAALVPILGALVGAISNVVSGLFAVGAAASSAAQSLVVIPSLLGAIIQGGIVMMASFQGVGAAVSAGFKQAQGVGSRAAAALGKTAKTSGAAVQNAARGIKDAQEAAAEGIRNATRSLNDAHRAHADALKEVQKAQEDLNDARKEAKERIIDLQFATEEGALAERRAAMELADARWQLNAASELPADNRLRQEAQLAYEEANLNLRMIKERNGDNVEELQEVKKQGINGMDEVVAAQERLQNAQEGVRDALRGVADAERALAQARKDGAEQIAAAKRALQDARAAHAGANQAMIAGGAAASAYQDALQHLSPAARDFVKYLVSIRGNLIALRDAGARGLFPGLTTALQTLVTGLFPTLERLMYRTGKAIGDSATQIAKDMTSGPFVGSFRRVTDQNAVTIERMGFVMGDLARVTVAVLDAARPLVNEFTIWFKKWANGLRITAEASNKTGEMSRAFERAGERMKLIISISKDLIEGFYDLGKVAAPFGALLLHAFKGTTEEFANFTDKIENRQALFEFFNNTSKNFIALSSLIKEVGAAFFRLGANPALAGLFASLEPTVQKLENLINTMLEENGTAIVDFINSIIDAFAALSGGGGLEAFLGVMTSFFNSLTAVMTGPAGPFLNFAIKIGAVMYALSLLRRFPGLGLLSKGLSGVTRWFFLSSKAGRFLTMTLRANLFALRLVAWQAAKTAGAFLWGKAVSAVRLMGGALRAVGLAMRFLLGPWGLVAVAVIGGLILMYKKVGWFKKGVDKLVDGFQWVFGKIVDAAKWLYDVLFGHSIFPDLLAGFQTIFSGIGKVVSFWVNMVVNYVRLWVSFFQNVVAPVFGWLFQNIVAPAFRGIGRVIRWAWNSAIKPVFNGWRIFIIKVLAPVIRWLWHKVVGPAFRGVGAVIRFAWNNGIRPVFNAFKFFITQILAPKIQWLWKNVVKPVWDSIGGKIRGIWNNFIAPAFRGIRNFIVDRLVPAFSRVKTAVTTMWDKIRDAAKAPVRFVINTIYNDGLRAALNKIPGVNLGRASVPFAQGGVLPGWSPGRDIHHFSSPTAGRISLSGGEAIMRPEWTREMGGPRAVKLLNAASKRGRRAVRRVMDYLTGPGDLGVDRGGRAAFASGGVLTSEQIKRGQDFMRAQLGKPYQMGGVGPGAYDCSGIVAAVTNAIHGVNPYHRLGSTATFPWSGWKSGVGQFTVGSTSNYRGSGVGHMAGKLGTMKIESYGGHGPSISNRSYTDPGFNEIAHLGQAGAPGKSPQEKKQESWLSKIKTIVSLVKKVVSNVKGMLNKAGDWWNIARKAAKSAVNKGINWANRKIPNNIGPFPLPDNPIPSFDRGGIARGAGWVAKGPKPERVLSPRQTAAFEELVRVLGKTQRFASGGVVGEKKSQVRSGTFNAHIYGVGARRAVGDLRRVLSGLDSVALQEWMGKGKGAALAYLRKAGFGFYKGPTGTAIAWRKSRFTASHLGSLDLNKKYRMPKGTSQRYVAYGLLTDKKSHRKFWQTSAHFIPGRGYFHGRVSAAHHAAIYHEQQKRHDALIRRLQRSAPVIAGGDWNKRSGHILTGLKSNLGGKGIDQIYSNLKAYNTRSINKLASDHNAKISTYKFDSGGIARGKGWMPKSVNSPERVLSPRQTIAFERMVEALDKRDATDNSSINLTVNVPQDASARDVVDGIVYEMRRMNRGGRYNR